MARDRMCSGKVRHRSKEGACIAVKRIGKPVDMNVYRCPICSAWHIGHSRDPYRTQARIDQILGRHERDLKTRLTTSTSKPPR